MLLRFPTSISHQIILFEKLLPENTAKSFLPIKFLKNILNPKFVNEVKLDTKPDGSSQATIIVDHGKKGLVVGRAGCNAEKARLFAKKYFNISSVLINSPTVTQLEM